MKLLVCGMLLALFVPSFSFTQTIQTGYAVVTPVSGTGVGLSVTEIFGEQVGDNFFQASVTGSPLVTLTNIVVSVNPSLGLNTGLAIVNPNNTTAIVTLTLGNDQGITLDTRTITLGARQQISEFVTELFSGNSEVASPLTGLLFISSPVPVGVLGLSFNGFSFTSLPVAAQLNISTTPTVATTTVIGTQPIVATLGGTFNTQPLVPTTITQIPSTFPTTIPQQSSLTTVTNPVVGLTPITGVAPVTGITPITPVTPLAGVSTTVTGVSTTLTGSGGTLTVTTPTSAATPALIVFPQLFVGVGGPGALLLPQVAAGAGWNSQITVSNISGVPQAVRVDFFNPFGAPFTLPFGSTVPNVVIPAGGVATLTTAVQ